MIEKIENSLMFNHSDKILLAVSGGVDSMVMFHLFTTMDYEYGVAHCNFSLRGDESDADTSLVERVASERGVTLHKIKFDTLKEIEKSGESLQMVARRLRYDWFEELCVDYGYTKIAIAHNSGDTIETFFINLVRGTGVRGLTGIPPIRERIIRPIMNISRDEIESYAKRNGVEWRNDSSNSGTKYLRNKLRHITIPQMNEIEPDFSNIMISNISKVSDAVSFIDCVVDEIRGKSFSQYRGRTTISLSILTKYNPFDFVLYELLSPFGFKHNVVTEIITSYNSSEESKKFESICNSAFLTRGLLIISPKEMVEYSGDIEIIESFNNIFSENNYKLEFELLDIREVNSFKESESAFFDADKISLPLSVRSWHEGDAFVPFGMTGRKKLSDYFVDNKINVLDKNKERLLINSNGDILWLIGKRSDNRYRVTKNSKRVLKIRYCRD